MAHDIAGRLPVGPLGHGRRWGDGDQKTKCEEIFQEGLPRLVCLSGIQNRDSQNKKKPQRAVTELRMLWASIWDLFLRLRHPSAHPPRLRDTTLLRYKRIWQKSPRNAIDHCGSRPDLPHPFCSGSGLHQSETFSMELRLLDINNAIHILSCTISINQATALNVADA